MILFHKNYKGVRSSFDVAIHHLLVLLSVISTKILITTENHSSRTGATFPCHESGNRPNASHPKLDAINISMQPEHTRHEPACYFLDILKSLNLHGVTRYFPFTLACTVVTFHRISLNCKASISTMNHSPLILF